MKYKCPCGFSSDHYPGQCMDCDYEHNCIHSNNLAIYNPVPIYLWDKKKFCQICEKEKHAGVCLYEEESKDWLDVMRALP